MTSASGASGASGVSGASGAKCAICLQNMTSDGEHRIASLKCGHVYGYSCISSWIDRTSRATCPKCRVSTGRGDIRVLHFDSDPVVPGEEPQSTEETVATPSVTEGPEALETELGEAQIEIDLADEERNRAQTLLDAEPPDLMRRRIVLNFARNRLNTARARLHAAFGAYDFPRTDLIAARARLNAALNNRNNILRELITAQSTSDGSAEAKAAIDVLWTREVEAQLRVDEESAALSRESDIILEARLRMEKARYEVDGARNILLENCQTIARRSE